MLCFLSALTLASVLPTVPPALASDDTGTTDTTLVWRVERDPSECIGFLPKPGCGYAPQDAGERGGALQITLFFVMIGAIAVIGTVVVRNVVRRDRALARTVAPSGTDDR